MAESWCILTASKSVPGGANLPDKWFEEHFPIDNVKMLLKYRDKGEESFQDLYENLDKMGVIVRKRIGGLALINKKTDTEVARYDLNWGRFNLKKFNYLVEKTKNYEKTP
jgi:hypothetical protein